VLVTLAAIAGSRTASAKGPERGGTDPAVGQDAAAEEQDSTDSAPAAADRPTRAPAHADCGHRMPLWIHEVEAGDQIGRIAGRYGVRSRDLLALNPDITNPDKIRVGQKIRVCPEIFPRVRERVEHVVKAGETASEIATKYELSTTELVAFQKGKLKDANRLREGATLEVWIDGGLVEDFQPPPPPKAKTKTKTSVGGKKRGPRPSVEVQLSAEAGIHLKRPHLAFGTKKTIGLLEQVARKYRARTGGGPKVVVGDISRRGGGGLGGHLSHRTGHDVDVGYVLRGADASRTHFSGVNADNLDVARTWALVKAFLDTGEVVYIFMDYAWQKTLYEYARDHGVSERELDELFQYPRGRGRSHGIVRHWKSHRHHFHVRFRD
jgi:hypothetical protein